MICNFYLALGTRPVGQSKQSQPWHVWVIACLFLHLVLHVFRVPDLDSSKPRNLPRTHHVTFGKFGIVATIYFLVQVTSATVDWKWFMYTSALNPVVARKKRKLPSTKYWPGTQKWSSRTSQTDPHHAVQKAQLLWWTDPKTKWIYNGLQIPANQMQEVVLKVQNVRVSLGP